jgi:two-component system, cell cycle response regulator
VARILVIEDNPINLELMTYLLRSWGHEVHTANDGASGLALARGMPFDLIVCDIQMPGALDGYAVARELKADPSLRGVPLVALTAFAMVGDSERSLQAGFDRHIAKPIDPERFMAVLAEVMPGGSGSRSAPAANAPPTRPQDGFVGAHEGVHESLRAPREGLVVLMADDLASNLEFKQSLLEPAGYEVITARNGAQALEHLRSHRVDLVLSDVMMDGGSGFELVTQLRADPALRHIPFVFLTSTARDSQSQARGLALGADAYLLRPIEPEKLLAEVRDELTRRR